MIYTCIIADDSPIERDLLSMFIAKMPQLKLVGVCEDGSEAAVLIANTKVDIVFSDIDMPNLTGTGLLKSLKNPPAFIFITSFRDYAVESFDLDVMDFIVKPLRFERLLKAVNKTIDYLQLKQSKAAGNGKLAAENIVFGEKDDHFFIKEINGITKIKYSDVVFIESMGDFSKVHTLEEQTHVVLSGLKYFEPQLPPSIFKRIHKQYIVNLSHISTVTSTHVQLPAKRTVPLSSTYRQSLLDAFVLKDVIKRTIK